MKRNILLCIPLVLASAALLWSEFGGKSQGQVMNGNDAATEKQHQSESPKPQPMRPLKLLADETISAERRVQAIVYLLEHGSEAEVLGVLDFLQQLAAAEDQSRESTELTHALLAALSSPMEKPALAACLKLILNQTNQLADAESMSPRFLDALTKGLRQQSPESELGSLLVESWQQLTDPLLRQRLDALEIPALFGGQVLAQWDSDAESALLSLARLETCQHPAAGQAILDLATVPQLPINELGNMMFNWSLSHATPEFSESMSAALSDPAFSQQQQGLAALALAAAANGSSHLPALQKSLADQPQGWLRDRLSQAIELLQAPQTAQVNTSVE